MQTSPSYWELFYKKSTGPKIPSQFSVFVAGEFPQAKFVIDIGCGNGRDSKFFLGLGISVVSVDQSESAIDGISSLEPPTGRLGAIASSINDPKLFDAIDQKLCQFTITKDDEGVIYARFFLHAITEQQEEAFFTLCSEICAHYKVAVAVEFRTSKDMNLAKATEAHYRRYIDPLKFMERASKWNFHADYFTEGFGFAKFKVDDAHVARLVMRKGQ